MRNSSRRIRHSSLTRAPATPTPPRKIRTGSCVAIAPPAHSQRPRSHVWPVRRKACCAGMADSKPYAPSARVCRCFQRRVSSSADCRPPAGSRRRLPTATTRPLRSPPRSPGRNRCGARRSTPCATGRSSSAPQPPALSTRNRFPSANSNQACSSTGPPGQIWRVTASSVACRHSPHPWSRSPVSARSPCFRCGAPGFWCR